ncbi:unnamed protein product, partial [Scytosiphon promiscuus]
AQREVRGASLETRWKNRNGEREREGERIVLGNSLHDALSSALIPRSSPFVVVLSSRTTACLRVRGLKAPPPLAPAMHPAFSVCFGRVTSLPTLPLCLHRT